MDNAPKSGLRRRAGAIAAAIDLWRTRLGSWWRRHYITAIVAFGLVLVPLWLWIVAQIVGTLAVQLTDPVPEVTEPSARRAHFYSLGLTLAGLGVLLAAPFTLIRLWINERLATTTEQGHVTDRITKAVEQLGAEKDVKYQAIEVRYLFTDDSSRVHLEPEGSTPRYDRKLLKRNPEYGESRPVSESVPNIEVRLGGIYALERIAQDSERDHIQIMEILCAYIRQNAPAREARDDAPALREDGIPTDEWLSALENWVADLCKPRADIQAALTVIGRRSLDRIAKEGAEGYRLDLRETNLQRADLTRARLDNALLTTARLDRANLKWARLQGADLRWAVLQVADLFGAGLQKANLMAARLQAASFREARLHGADFTGAVLQEAQLQGAQLQGAFLGKAQLQEVNLFAAQLQGAILMGARLQGTILFLAALKSIDLRLAEQTGEHFRVRLAEAFGDGSVMVPADWGWDSYETGRPAHWPLEVLDEAEFERRWRDWQKESGVKPSGND